MPGKAWCCGPLVAKMAAFRLAPLTLPALTGWDRQGAELEGVGPVEVGKEAVDPDAGEVPNTEVGPKTGRGPDERAGGGREYDRISLPQGVDSIL